MKRMMGAVALAITLLAAPGAMAQGRDDDAAKLALANKYVALMQGDQMNAAFAGMIRGFAPPKSETLSAEDAAKIQDVMAQALPDMLSEMFDAMAPVYADIFTIEELQALVDFHSSDVGRSMTQKTYAAAPRLNEAMQSAMPRIMARMADQLCTSMKCTPDQRRALKAEMAKALP